MSRLAMNAMYECGQHLRNLVWATGIEFPDSLRTLMSPSAWKRNFRIRKVATFQRLLARAFVEICAGKSSFAAHYCVIALPEVATAIQGDRQAVCHISWFCYVLSTVSDVEIRINFARIHHQIVSILATEDSRKHFIASLTQLLKDPVLEVQLEALLHARDTLNEILKVSSKQEVTGMQRIMFVLFEALINCRDEVLAEIVTVQIVGLQQKYPRLIAQRALFYNLRRLYFLSEHDSVQTCAAIQTVHLSRRVKVPEMRDAFLLDFLRDLSSVSSKTRSAIITCTNEALSVYSPKIFMKIFPEHVLNLARDSDSIVRARLAAFIPQLAPWCQDHESFEQTLKLLREDGDDSVSSALLTYVDKASAAIIKNQAEKAITEARWILEQTFFLPERKLVPMKARAVDAVVTSIKQSGAQLRRFASKITVLSWSRVTSGSERLGPSDIPASEV